MEADISGNFSGNSGDNNVFGSNNITNLNTGNLNHVTNLGRIYQGCVFGAGNRGIIDFYERCPAKI